MECNVDWLTATMKLGEDQRALARLADDWLLDRSCEGFKAQGWRWNGYVGSRTDGISYGKRDDGWILRLSSSMAARHWLTAVTWAHNVTRLDVQTTILASEVRDEHAWHSYTILALDPRVAGGGTTSRYVEDTPSGSTLYVGSRSSNRLFRLYDKSAESKGEYPNRSWRYEIEYKGERAHNVARRISKDHHPTQAIFDCLQNAYHDYGLEVPANRPAWAWRDAGIAHQSDDERRLAWLARCIRPCVARLSEAFGVDTVLDRLGINEEVDELTGEVEWTINRDLADSFT